MELAKGDSENLLQKKQQQQQQPLQQQQPQQQQQQQQQQQEPHELFIEWKNGVLDSEKRISKSWAWAEGGMRALIDIINAQPDCVITKCIPPAARLLMQPLRDDEGSNTKMMKRRRVDWTAPFSSIKPFEPEYLLSRVDPALGDLLFVTDPPEVTVACATVDKAIFLLKIAVGAGFTESGMSVDTNGRFAMTLRSSPSLKVPLCEDSVMLVSQIYMMFLTDMANEHLRNCDLQLKHCAIVMSERLVKAK